MTVNFQSPSRRGDHRFAASGRETSIPILFQSPSRRGDHRFARSKMSARYGVDFQSPSRRGDHRFGGPVGLPPAYSDFQSPSRRGDHRFSDRSHGVAPASQLSIPFTSGRSSVLFNKLPGPIQDLAFNPLHVGAIIGSEVENVMAGLSGSFNPLHVGAIIGSSRASKVRGRLIGFQSPSRRGDHRFITTHFVAGDDHDFQSPSRRGDHRFLSIAAAA